MDEGGDKNYLLQAYHRREGSRKKLIYFPPLPQMGPDIINLKQSHSGLCWEGWKSSKGSGWAGAGGAEWAPATAAGAGCSLIPSWAWLCSWARLARAGHTLWCPGHTLFVSGTVHRQDLSTGSLLLVPLLQESKPTVSCKAISFWLCPRPN